MTQPEPHSRSGVLGRRVGALLIDSAVFVAAFIAVAVAAGSAHAGHSRASASLGPRASAIFALATLAYFFACETAAGRTLGKRLLGIRVTTLDGRRPSAGQVLMRTVLRIVDGLPILYLVGFVSALATGERRQRLGDLAAGTTVTRS